MTCQQLAQNAYNLNSTIRTDRGIEYDAFVRVTRQLSNAIQKGPAGFSALAQALHLNRRLWTILAAAVADKENALPNDLRARLFYLAEFTDAHSRQVLQGTAKADPLIEVNTAIMRGLRAGGAER